MRKVILESRNNQPGHEWSEWRTVWLIKENKNSWKIWSLWEPFTRYVHKKAMGERIIEL